MVSAREQLDRNLHIAPGAIEEFATRWHLRKLSVFGSVLRDDFNQASDIDILIEPGENTPRGFRPRMAMEDELMALLGRKIDLVYISGLVNPIRRKAILSTAHMLYAA